MSELNIHRPHHDSQNLPGEYFITGRIVNGQKLLISDNRKHLFFHVLINLCYRHELELVAWVITDNHYHILIVSDKVFKMSRFMSSLHAVTSKLINDEDKQSGRRVWDQYWDRRIRDEKESWMTFNYIHWNPIKHGVVSDFSGATEYKFSSMGLWIEQLGQEAVEIFYEQYPIDEFDPFNR